MIDRYRNILVPMDGSKQSENAFEEAVAVAKRNDATLYILHIIDNSSNYWSQLTLYTQEVMSDLKQNAEEEMNQYVAKAIQSGLTSVKCIVEFGVPKSTIVNFDEADGPIDLIMIGATGLNAVGRVFIGSTTSYVVTHSKCNVMVVK